MSVFDILFAWRQPRYAEPPELLNQRNARIKALHAQAAFKKETKEDIIESETDRLIRSGCSPEFARACAEAENK